MLPSKIFTIVRDTAAREAPGLVVDFGFAATSQNGNFSDEGERIVMRPADAPSEWIDEPVAPNPLGAAFDVFDLYEFACFGLASCDCGVDESLANCDRSLVLADLVIRALVVPYRAFVAYRGARWNKEPRQNATCHEYILLLAVRRPISSKLRAPDGQVPEPPYDLGRQLLSEFEPINTEVSK